jgi:hypothetical protein
MILRIIIFHQNNHFLYSIQETNSKSKPENYNLFLHLLHADLIMYPDTDVQFIYIVLSSCSK